MRKRKRDRRTPGEPRGTIHPLLDLHGLTGDEAVRRTDAWLRVRQTENVRTVVVVTGRGRHSGGTPVLPGEVALLLERLTGTVVAGFAPEASGGSFRVELRRPSPGDLSAPAAPAEPLVLRHAPAQLRRQAEETLWELGITPTPTLLAAEVRRLMAQEDDDG
jgi:hypothetical protein